MKKKILKLYIDEYNFPRLFNIKNENLREICFDIFKKGYDNYFPEKTDSDTNLLKNLDYHTDSIKLDIAKLNNHLEGVDFDNKLEQFSNILEELLGITTNSSKKGKMAEDMIYKMLKNKYKDYTIEETRGMPHHGDGIINIPKDNGIDKVMIEIKNYSKPVNSDEIEKLKYDMKFTNIKYSLFLSLRSGFVGKKQMSIEEFISDNKTYYIIYVPNIMGEFGKVEATITLIERLIELEKNNKNKKNIKWLETNITNYLQELDKLYTDYTILKNKYHKMEKSIKDSLSEYYLEMRSYEVELKKKINLVWKSVNSELGKVKKDLIIDEKTDRIINSLKKKKSQINRTIVKVIHILVKYNYELELININNKDSLFSIIYKNNVLGRINKKNKEVKVTLNDPYIILNIKNSYNDKDLATFENILEVYSK